MVNKNPKQLNSIFFKSSTGFSLVELILIIVLLGILSAAAYIKWPTGLNNRAAVLELTRVIRYTQHVAMTRVYDPAHILRLKINADKYTITDGTTAVSAEFNNQYLLGDSSITLTGITLYYNGLGEPVNSSGVVLNSITSPSFTVNGTSYLTVCPQTGYVLEGSTCP
ncbi:prepilin-type N-terminal cleavage/methylation domain-containing protein [Desulfobacterota bacterium M19]